MTNWSRRRALQAAVAVGTVSLAGCSGSTSSSNSAPRERGEPVSDVEVRFARDRKNRHLYDVSRNDDREAGGLFHVTNDDDRDDVTFRSTEPAAELRSFVDATDLESGSVSVYLFETSIGECYEARLLGVYREPDGVDTEFCRALKPADVDCSTDDRDRIGIAIRLPFSGDDFHSFGSSWGSDCEHRGTAIAREGGKKE